MPEESPAAAFDKAPLLDGPTTLIAAKVAPTTQTSTNINTVTTMKEGEKKTYTNINTVTTMKDGEKKTYTNINTVTTMKEGEKLAPPQDDALPPPYELFPDADGDGILDFNDTDTFGKDTSIPATVPGEATPPADATPDTILTTTLMDIITVLDTGEETHTQMETYTYIPNPDLSTATDTSTPSLDSDGDGTPDDKDQFPYDPFDGNGDDYEAANF